MTYIYDKGMVCPNVETRLIASPVIPRRHKWTSLRPNPRNQEITQNRVCDIRRGAPVCAPNTTPDRKGQTRRSAPTWTVFILIFICCLFNNAALAQSHENGGAVTEHTLQIPEGGIVIGDSLPESFWKQELQVVNHPRGRKSIRLSSYKHQLLVLDFLNTACVPCIASVDKWNQLQRDFRLEVTVLPIHLYGDNSRIAAFATEKKWEMPIAVGNAADTLINQLFYAHKSFGQVWIKDGKLLAIPHNRDVSVSLVEKALNGKPLDIQMNDMMTYFDRRYFDVEGKED